MTLNWSTRLNKDVLAFLDKRPEQVEVILTGRNARKELINIADLVSDTKVVKHYYNQGVQALDGIERQKKERR